MSSMIRMLAVDDEAINLAIIAECLAEDGYEIDQAGDGEKAWEMMQATHYDLLVLDRMMPRLDGLSLLKRLKADPNWAATPVILQTAATAQDEVREGLEAGAHYYLTKPYDPEALRVLVRSVVTELREKQKLRDAEAHLGTALTLLEQADFGFRTLHEARDLAAALSHLCAEPTLSAMGLVELLVNAVEHGNLGITYAEKSALRQSLGWEDEVERRLASAPWCERRGVIAVRRDGDTVEFTVTDQGNGFDWRPFLDFDPERAFDLNGRGIAMARQLGFDSVDYQGAGNIVVARAKARSA